MIDLQQVWILVRKDLTLFFRNSFFVLITALVVIAYGVIYYVLPRQVDEIVEIGMVIPQQFAAIVQGLGEEGLDLVLFEGEADLRQAVLEGDLNAGIVLPEELAAQLQAGKKGQVRLLLSVEFPQELKDAYVALVEELGYYLVGQADFAIEFNEEIIGEDRSGEQIPLRDRMLPLFAIMVLIMETMGTSTLLVEEIEGRTLPALLAAPLGLGELFTSKGLIGFMMAFGQGLLLMGITGGLRHQALLVIVILALGALLVTGIGFFLASLGRDMLSVIGWGVLAILILSIPAVGVIIPGTLTQWARLIPSYYLVDAANQVINYGAGWAQSWGNLLILLAFDALVFLLGIAALRRKIA